ncbi:hypothetical protein A4H97_04855 [Niastella yeongjuensis]|uniref:Uncharacterized protein n=1 Tax=Niastella yeongjuensis TaxID=354355 RepID=A0A1V9EL58_9BACT|nr:hypothetical protein [Niastella yeongjuensis]OQP46856.1 hypothetical protein A4H97_04855 [Niastella yeongjuensis]SEN57336.1 hypothetical protein SAMN05660816_00994 [Niastella yeongjuensis]
MEWNDQLIEEALRQSAASLEKRYPAGLPPATALWTAIDTKRKHRRAIRVQRWSVAATIILLATAITLWPGAKKETDLSSFQHKIRPLPATEKEAMAYIKRVCRGNNIICDSPAFKELQSDLDASSTALADINQQLKIFGNDEQLIRAKTRIENHQARIVKAMLQTL